jgi:hypothetical protein
VVDLQREIDALQLELAETVELNLEVPGGSVRMEGNGS